MDRQITKRQAEIVALYETGLSFRAVGAAAGISSARVGQILDTCGVTRRVRQESATAKDARERAERVAARTKARQQVLVLWDEGKSRKAISTALGVTTAWVEQVVKTHGKPRFRRPGPGVKITDEMCRMAANLRAGGHKAGAISAMSGVPRDSVSYALRRAEALGCTVERRRPPRVTQTDDGGIIGPIPAQTVLTEPDL